MNINQTKNIPLVEILENSNIFPGETTLKCSISNNCP